MKHTAKALLLQIDNLNKGIAEFEEEKRRTFIKLGDVKKEIEMNHSYLIGKRAMCIHVDNPNPVECVCTKVIANDDYESVRPLFMKNGKKYSVDTYEFID